VIFKLLSGFLNKKKENLSFKIYLASAKYYREYKRDMNPELVGKLFYCIERIKNFKVTEIIFNNENAIVDGNIKKTTYHLNYRYGNEDVFVTELVDIFVRSYLVRIEDLEKLS
jgi:hypothetical protein